MPSVIPATAVRDALFLNPRSTVCELTAALERAGMPLEKKTVRSIVGDLHFDRQLHIDVVRECAECGEDHVAWMLRP